MDHPSQQQLQKLVLELAKKTDKCRKKKEAVDAEWRNAQSVYESARRLYVGLYGEEPIDAGSSSSQQPYVPERKKRVSREDYEHHIITYLQTVGSAHYEDVQKALLSTMDRSVTVSGVYKALHRFVLDEKSRITKGERRGFFTLKKSTSVHSFTPHLPRGESNFISPQSGAGHEIGSRSGFILNPSG